jgi:hypothetical protein
MYGKLPQASICGTYLVSFAKRRKMTVDRLSLHVGLLLLSDFSRVLPHFPDARNEVRLSAFRLVVAGLETKPGIESSCYDCCLDDDVPSTHVC